VFPAGGGATSLDPVALLERLNDNRRELEQLLDEVSLHRKARSLARAAAKAYRSDTGELQMYSPHTEELLRASQETGQMVIIHNDAGLARLGIDGLYKAGATDERYLMPLIGLLRKYEGANVVLAHLGLGKWTTFSDHHLEVIDWILRNFPEEQVNFDVSWNDLAQHIKASEKTRKRFVQLVLDHPTRFLWGSDSVKAPTLDNYERHYHDMTPLFEEIESRPGGKRAVQLVLHGNAARVMGNARRRGQQWAFDEITSGKWDEFLDALPAHRRQFVLDWVEEQRAAGRVATRGEDGTIPAT